MFPFRRVQVHHAMEGGARVEWELSPRFHDPSPHLFQLQAASTSAAEADWEDVGSVIDNGFFAVDDDKRLHGKTLETHYRVKLETPKGTYFSDPTSVLSAQQYRDWRLARKILLQERKRASKYTGVKVLLLKEKRFGARCPSCIDFLLDEVNRSDCEECFGVGFVDGYFKAVPDLYLDLGIGPQREHQDVEKAGTVKEAVIQARFAGFPLLSSYDVFVEAETDRRWYVHTVTRQAELKGYPLVAEIELRMAPFNDPIYRVPLT